MSPHQHTNNNDVLGAPPGVSADRCVPLPITRIIVRDSDERVEDFDAVVSYWKPSVEEVERIVSGMSIRLTVWGRTHPPLVVEVDGDGHLS